MTLKDFTARVRQAVSRVTHYSATVSLANRRIKHLRNRQVTASVADKQKLRRRIIYWRTRRAKALDLRVNWRDILTRRRAQKKRYQKNHPGFDHSTGGFLWVNPDGTEVPVPLWMVGWADGPDGDRHDWLAHAKRLGWNGYVTSGIRTAAHSVELCEQICGAPSCPGRCAGVTSNHVCDHGCPEPSGAIDVEDYFQFGAIMAEIGAPLRNDLPSDPVHFSYTGH